MKDKKIILYDLETNSVNPYEADILQIAALAIDQKKLEIIPNSIFNTWVCPENANSPDYLIKHNETLTWHAKNFNITPEEFLDKIRKSPHEKIAWENFVAYLSKYHDRPTNQNMFSSPIPSGFNIRNFDSIIINRYSQKYNNVDGKKQSTLFYSRDTRDILDIVSLWLSPLNEVKSFSMDNLRNYFGMETAGGHEAKKDILDEAAILLKFLRLHQDLAKRIPFKNTFAKKD